MKTNVHPPNKLKWIQTLPILQTLLRILSLSLLVVVGSLELSATTRFFNPTKFYNTKGNEAYAEASIKPPTRFYTKAKKILPNNPKVLNNLATVFHKLGRYEDAENLYQTAIAEITPTTQPPSDTAPPSRLLLSQLYYNLGNHYLERDLYHKAIQAYKHSLTENDKDIQAKKNLEIALERIAEQTRSQQNQSTPQNEQTSGPSTQNKKKSKPSKSSLSKNTQPDTPSPTSKKSVTPLEQGLDRSSGSSDPNLPEEAQNSRIPQNPTQHQDFISRKRANEILESFEERYKNFQRLDHRTTPPDPAQKQKKW